MDKEPLDQLQQLLQTQQRLWRHLYDEAQTQPWAEAMKSSEDRDDRAAAAKVMADGAKAYAEFAAKLVGSLQDDENDENDDAIQVFIDQFQQFREKLIADELNLPPGYEALFRSFAAQDASFSSIPFFQGQWNQHLGRMQQRFTQAQTVFSQFQQSYLAYQHLEQLLNQEVAKKVYALLEQEDKENQGLRAFVDLWVDTYEQAYQQLIRTEKYQQTYQALITHSAELQAFIQGSWEEEYRLFGLVPTEDYDQLLARHHQLQKTVRKQQKQLDQLSLELAALKNTQSAPSAPEKTATKSSRKGAGRKA